MIRRAEEKQILKGHMMNIMAIEVMEIEIVEEKLVVNWLKNIDYK